MGRDLIRREGAPVPSRFAYAGSVSGPKFEDFASDAENSTLAMEQLGLAEFSPPELAPTRARLLGRLYVLQTAAGMTMNDPMTPISDNPFLRYHHVRTVVEIDRYALELVVRDPERAYEFAKDHLLEDPTVPAPRPEWDDDRRRLWVERALQSTYMTTNPRDDRAVGTAVLDALGDPHPEEVSAARYGAVQLAHKKLLAEMFPDSHAKIFGGNVESLDMRRGEQTRPRSRRRNPSRGGSVRRGRPGTGNTPSPPLR